MSGIILIIMTRIFIILFISIILSSCLKEEEPIQNINIEYLNSGTENNLNCVFFIDDSKAFIGGESGTVLFTNNSGESWSKKNIQTEMRISNIYFSNDTGVVILNKDTSKYYYTFNNGSTWVDSSNSFISNFILKAYIDYGWKGAYFFDDNSGISVTDSSESTLEGDIFRYSTTGSRTKESTGITYNLYDVHFYDNNNGFAVGENSLLKSTDNGKSWTWLADQDGTNIGEGEENVILNGVFCLTKESGIALGNNGLILKFYY